MGRVNATLAAYWLALLLGVAYAAGGILGWIADVTEGDGSDLAFWLVLLLGGALLIFAGLFGTRRWIPPMSFSTTSSSVSLAIMPTSCWPSRVLMV